MTTPASDTLMKKKHFTTENFISPQKIYYMKVFFYKTCAN